MTGTGNPETWAVGERDTVIAALDRAVAAHPDRILLDFAGTFVIIVEKEAFLCACFVCFGHSSHCR